MHTYTHTRMHTYTHTRMHMYTHTHKQKCTRTLFSIVASESTLNVYIMPLSCLQIEPLFGPVEYCWTTKLCNSYVEKKTKRYICYQIRKMYSLIYNHFLNIDPSLPLTITSCRQLISHHPQIAATQSEALNETSSNSRGSHCASSTNCAYILLGTNLAFWSTFNDVRGDAHNLL